MMTVLRNEPSRVEAIVLKKRLGANASGRILWEKLQETGDYLTAGRAIKVLKEQRALSREHEKTDSTDEDNLLAILTELQQERLMDRPRNKRDCCAMLKYCASTDPNLAAHILEETTAPFSQLSTEELLKPLRDRLECLGRGYPNERFRSTRHSKEFVGAIYGALGVFQRRVTIDSDRRSDSGLDTNLC
eukprot:Gregarina_sp_Pseudo_9__2521@NODE_2797_length_869_cov_9_184337_g1710_i1_p1_GENE_NODE_2797_length_869_cov_9_184337_g1710_i1NODE_2797_length_869_cov_9_184337_g1710_i1_p1_ORF_typecomplete_len189_score25_68DUF1175/PF06672_11/0_086_NODE_2797_length_869_cov_9_184337_g1710_i180646